MKDYLRSLEERLEAKTITVLEARDGILESYVVSNRKGLRARLTDLAIDATDDEVFERIWGMMRGAFTERGADFANPTVSELRSVRHTMDLKLRFPELPLEINETHDIICEMLLAKAEESNVPEGLVVPSSLEESLGALGEKAELEWEERLDAILTPKEEQSPFQAALNERLSYATLSPQDARDGIIECFVQTNSRLREQGVREAIRASEGEVELFIRGMMRDFIASEGASFEEPDIAVLGKAKLHLDEKMNLDRVPTSIHRQHDEICATLLAKARTLVETLGTAVTPPAAPRITAPSLTESLEPVSSDGVPEEAVAEVASDVRMDEIVSKVRPYIQEIVRQEIDSLLRPQPCMAPEPPSGIVSHVDGRAVFLLWLDLLDQPGYHVYRREGSNWIRVTDKPLQRPSFCFQAEEEGELVFAVTSVRADGIESRLSSEVRIRV